jgi:hypothetical protein
MSELLMKYFVLKPRGTDLFARASRAAMFRYAKEIMEQEPIFSKQVWDWAAKEMAEAQCPDESKP